MASDDELKKLIADWLKWDRNETTRKEIVDLSAAGNFDELRKRLCSRQGFGTAGIRARMGAGFNCLNDLVIIQTTQGMLKYLEKCEPDLKAKGVVIGFDGRHNSERFASLAAAVFLSKHVKVRLLSKLVPTPLTVFAVQFYKASAGIMITASHNPKEDNGYKVYWSNGAQIMEPHDKEVMAEVQRQLEPWPESWNTKLILASPLRIDPLPVVWEAYLNEHCNNYCNYAKENSESNLKFTYTAFHGVGYHYYVQLMKRFGFSTEKNLVFVEEQIHPDPEFPTVKFPNPEEGKPVLQLAIAAAERGGSRLILANDPDADRLQLAEKQRDGQWRVFTGNEMGALLCWWVWTQWRRKNPEKAGSESFKNVHMLNSTVSSKFMRTFANAEGFQYGETLTGFKWLCNKAHELRSQGKEVPLVWEESIGFMCGASLDKDGVAAGAMFAEYAVYLDNQFILFSEHLDSLYQKYGYHLSFGSYFLCYDPATMRRIFEEVRNHSGPGKYLQELGGIRVKYVRDLGTGFDSSQTSGKATLPWSAGTLMITLSLEDDSVVTLRASGTEPKIKYYLEVKTEQGGSLAQAEEKLRKIEAAVIALLEPEKNKLLPKET